MIFNYQVIHTETQSDPLGFEVHGTAYAYVCNDINDQDSNTALNNTTFYNFKIFNRSNNTYTQSKIGLWTDIEIGDYSDDYIACNPSQNYAIGYNGKAIDGKGNFTDYGISPPAIAQVILKGPNLGNNQYGGMSNFIYYNNDPSLQGNPRAPIHYWNYLNSKWTNGTPITYGDNGFEGDTPSNYMFPREYLEGKPFWSEESANRDPGDRRYLMSINANTFKPKDSIEITYAIIWSRQNDTLNWPNPILNKLEKDVIKIKNWYSLQNFPSCLDLNTGVKKVEILLDKKYVTVYPNPSSNVIKIITNLEAARYLIYDLTGKLLFQGSLIDTDEIIINNLTSGLYILRLKTDDLILTTKFLKEY